ncbi:hypothetical protein [Nonomuraea sediminis]|uniref:hypothetical protein n=1 Tax=Nonomuraea sediminis TaxID=2835864 RepID=UPI001BDDAE12|nr:hypothetical protein [Nonomuraea sediminis]
MLQRIRVAAVALAVGAGALALAPAASAATGAKAPGISDVGISPSPPIVVFDNPVTATFSFTTKGAGKAELQLKAPGDVSVGTPVTLTPSPHGTETKWTGTRSFEAKDAGKWSFLVIAHGDKDESSARGTFEVRKALDTKIVDFDANPDLVSKGDLIRVSGRLLANGQGYGGQNVTITFREKGTDAFRHVTTTTTRGSGWFSTKVRADSTGWWRAEFAGNKFARSSVSDTDRVDVKFRNRDSRIVGFDAYPEPVNKGDRLNFTGVLQASGWDPLPGERVSIFFRSGGSDRWEYVTSDVTGRDGRFRAAATAVESGWWRAVFRGDDGVNGSVSDADWVTVNQPTPPPAAKSDSRLIKFDAYPEPAKRGHYLRFKGKLQIDDAGTWEGYGAKVRLYFKPKGSSHWQYVKTVWSTGSGKIYTKAKAWKSGTWKMVFRGDADFYGDTSRLDYVRVKR